MKEQELFGCILGKVVSYFSMMCMPIVEPALRQGIFVLNTTLAEGSEISLCKLTIIVAQTRLHPIKWVAAVQYEKTPGVALMKLSKVATRLDNRLPIAVGAAPGRARNADHVSVCGPLFKTVQQRPVTSSQVFVNCHRQRIGSPVYRGNSVCAKEIVERSCAALIEANKKDLWF